MLTSSKRKRTFPFSRILFSRLRRFRFRPLNPEHCYCLNRFSNNLFHVCIYITYIGYFLLILLQLKLLKTNCV